MTIKTGYSSAGSKTSWRMLLLAGGALAGFGFGPAAWGQTAPAAAAPSSTGVEEVVVTARRRDENIERVPVSVTAFGAQDLSRRQIATQSDLQRTTPGLLVRETQNKNQQNFSIRGQSIDAYSQAQPGVLTYVDEYQNPVVSAASFYDLASIQVLKGPQGTLFGRNTTGGAVLVTTTPPQLGVFGGNVDATFGNYNQRKFEAAVNIPVSDSFAFRIAGASERRDGYVHNVVTGQDVAQTNDDSIRVSARWKPTDHFENRLVAQYDHGGGLGDPLEPFSANAPGSTEANGTPLTTTSASYFSPLLDNLAGVGAYAALRSVTPGAPPGGYLQIVQMQKAAGPWVTFENAPLNHSSFNVSVVDTMTYRFNNGIEIKNIAGYSKNRNSDGSDTDGSPFSVVNDVIENDNSTVSDELHLTGKAFDDRLNYIVGTYFSRQISGQTQTFTFLDLGPVANPLFGTPQSSIVKGQTDDQTQGVFAQGTYKLDQLLSGLSMTFGGRYTWEQIHFRELSGFAPFYPDNVVEKSAASNPSWNFSLEYQATHDLLFYVAQRGSWRSGGFNQSAPPINALSTAGGNAFLPEKTRDVEIGAKFGGDIAGVPTRLNVSAYNQWVDNIQRVLYLTLPSGLTALTTNVPGGAQFYGLELDFSAKPTPWLEVGGSYAFTKANYGNPNSQTIFNRLFAFDTFADIAEHAGSAYAQITIPTPDRWGRLALRSDVYAQTGTYIANTGKSSAPNTLIPGYTLVNMKLSLDQIDGKPISLSVYVRNLANERYYAGGISNSSLLGYNTVVPGQPRFYGVELGYSF